MSSTPAVVCNLLKWSLGCSTGFFFISKMESIKSYLNQNESLYRELTKRINEHSTKEFAELTKSIETTEILSKNVVCDVNNDQY